MARKSCLVYVDESGIDEYLHRELARAMRGKKITESIPGKKFLRWIIMAAKCEKRNFASSATRRMQS
jgi:hypothetical protein